MMIAPRTQRIVGPDQMARLSSWNARKPVIAIMGEFSAGKSTLLNMLIGRSILPTQVTATKLPPVWLRHGSDAPYRVDKSNRRHPIDLNDLATVPVKDTRYIRIFCEAEVLESCDLLDTPGISDPNIPMNWWIKTLGYANAVLWCSHAGQAWRESERSAWESLPERLRRHSLLLITRSDKITSDIDRMKIDTRLRRETENLFGGRLFISLTNALRALEGEGDVDLWASSGAETFVDMLAGSIAAINDDRTVAIRRYRVDPASMPRVTPRRVRPAAADEGGVSDPIETPRPAGAEVVTLRPMRVVSTNDSPIEAAVAQRPTLHEVTGQDHRGVLILDDAVQDHDAHAEPAKPVVESVSDLEFVTAFAPDLPADDAPVFAAEPVEDLTVDADFIRETMSLSIYDDEHTTEFSPRSVTAEDAPTDVNEQIASEVSGADDAVDMQAEPPAQPEDITVADEVAVAAGAEQTFTIAGLAFEEVAHEELVMDDAEDDTALTIMARLKEVEQAMPSVNPFDQRPAPEADETISSIMAEMARDDETEQDEEPEQSVEPDAPLSATGLWNSVLAGQDIQSVGDLMAAMTQFVTALDAAGFQIAPATQPLTEAERELAAQLHRRRMRAARRRQA